MYVCVCICFLFIHEPEAIFIKFGEEVGNIIIIMDYEDS